MDVTRSRPMIVSFDNTGFSAYSPVGFGAEITWITTGPCAVNSTCREYTTPGMSVWPRIGAAATAPGATKSPAKRT
jgi:hypothetical protein